MVVRGSGARLAGLSKSPARERAVAYFEGRQAAEHQKTQDACPYQDEPRRRVWLLGWHSAAAGQGERRVRGRARVHAGRV